MKIALSMTQWETIQAIPVKIKNTNKRNIEKGKKDMMNNQWNKDWKIN